MFSKENRVKFAIGYAASDVVTWAILIFVACRWNIFLGLGLIVVWVLLVAVYAAIPKRRSFSTGGRRRRFTARL